LEFARGQAKGAAMKFAILAAFALGLAPLCALGQDDEEDFPGSLAAFDPSPPHGGPSLVGDPLKASDGSVVHNETDLVVHDSLGDVAFNRLFVSDPHTLRQRTPFAVAAPFGRTQTGALHWTHNFVSYVMVRAPGFHDGEFLDEWRCVVRHTDGSLSEFKDCPVAAGEASSPSTMSEFLKSNREIIRYTNVTPQPSAPRLFWTGPEKFIVNRPGIGRLHYTARVDSSCGYRSLGLCRYFFLTQVETPQMGRAGSPRTHFNVFYHATLGPPYVSLVEMNDGAQIEFEYNTEKELTSISLRGRDGRSALVKSFNSSGGRILTATAAETGVVTNYEYSYNPPGPVPAPPISVFRVLRGRSELFRKELRNDNSGRAYLDFSPKGATSLAKETVGLQEPDCRRIFVPFTECSSERMVFEREETTGLGLGSTASLRTRYLTNNGTTLRVSREGIPGTSIWEVGDQSRPLGGVGLVHSVTRAAGGFDRMTWGRSNENGSGIGESELRQLDEGVQANGPPLTLPIT
jgi:hypothetical protein